MPGLAARADRRPSVPRTLLLLGLIVTLLSSCLSTLVQPPSPSVTPLNTTAAAQSTLDAVGLAVLRRDRASFDRQISHRDPQFPAAAGRLFAGLSGVGLTRLALQLRPLGRELSSARRELLGGRAFVQQVSVDWQLTGDVGPAQHLIWVTFLPGSDRVTIAGTTDVVDAAAAEPLWLTGSVTVRRGPHSTVVGTGGRPATSWVRRAESAAAAVRRLLRGSAAAGWNGDLVVELPATRQAFERVLGVKPDSYAQIAAAAWPEGPDPATAAIRVVVNPEQAARLDAQGLDVLLTHEAVHVATRSAVSKAPTWLVEGLADYVAYSSYPATAPTALAALLRQVRDGGAPAAVPADAQFAPAAGDLLLRYAEAWTLCRYLAETYTPGRLERFYRAVSSGRGLDPALKSEFGISAAQLTARWQAYLEAAAGPG